MSPRSLRLRPLLALAGVLALPAPVLADTPGVGQVVPGNGEDQYFNEAECKGTGTLELSWLLSAPASAGVIRIYATNTEPTKPTDSTVLQCETQDKPGTSPIYAGLIDPPGEIVASSSYTQRTLDVNIGLLAEAGLPGSPIDCTSDGATVHVCVQFYPYQTGTTPASSPSASATGKFILSTKKPATPTGLSLKVGDTRLYAKWSAGSSGAAVADYKVVATPVDTSLPTRSKVSTTTSATVDGLENDKEYAVVVFARSISGTLSTGSDPQNSIPRHVKDFWEVYEEQGGQEQGGCGGPAGPLALLSLAGFAALLRAGRRS